jgi:undecaprenyl-diphosphatase
MELPLAIQRFDIAFFYLINNKCHNGVLDLLMPFITELGSSYFITATGLFLLIFNRKGLKALGLLTLSGVAISETVSTVLKGIFSRPRPFFMFKEMNLLCHKSYTGSFPSGHTMLVFTMASLMASLYPRTGKVLFVLASVVGLSRVYVGAHFPTDVIAGAALGLLIGRIIAYVWKKNFSTLVD